MLSARSSYETSSALLVSCWGSAAQATSRRDRRRSAVLAAVHCRRCKRGLCALGACHACHPAESYSDGLGLCAVHPGGPVTTCIV